jgi:hypothetical protein
VHLARQGREGDEVGVFCSNASDLLPSTTNNQPREGKTEMASGNRKGGGLGSRVVREVGVRNGTPAREMRPRGVSQIGSSMGNHPTEGGRKATRAVEPVRGAALPSAINVPLGNEIAARGLGVGGGRDVSRSGSQCVHGPVNLGGGRIANTKGQWPDTKR